MFEKIPFADASARFDLTVLPAYDDTEDVIVVPAGEHKASDIDLELHSYVVDGDLVLDGVVRASDEGHFLLVRGDFTIESLIIGGPMVHVGGDLTARHAVHADYNHGYLFVGGDLRAAVVAAEHEVQVGGELRCETSIDFGGLRVASPDFTPTLTREQAVHESAAFFVPEVLNEGGYVDGPTLAELLADGGNPMRARPGD